MSITLRSVSAALAPVIAKQEICRAGRGGGAGGQEKAGLLSIFPTYHHVQRGVQQAALVARTPQESTTTADAFSVCRVRNL